MTAEFLELDVSLHNLAASKHAGEVGVLLDVPFRCTGVEGLGEGEDEQEGDATKQDGRNLEDPAPTEVLARGNVTTLERHKDELDRLAPKIQVRLTAMGPK